ncbi:MAG: transcription antitermination factor NusB [Bacteroidota bacterium]
MQNFYAFYVCKQASYECALGQIRLAFTPDVFANPPADQVQLAKDQAQALALFQSLREPKQAAQPEALGYDSQVIAAIERACLHYESGVAQDLKQLQNSWKVATNKTSQACLYILQLFLAWADVAHQEAERPRLSQEPSSLGDALLSRNRILARLRADTAFMHLAEHHTTSWGDKTDLVVSWYNQFIKKDATLQHDSSQQTTLRQDKELLVYLLQTIVLAQEAIQEFFTDLDLSWTEHGRIVKKMVRQALDLLEEHTAKESIWDILETATTSEAVENFYTNLISKTLAQEQELDALIEQNSKNWAIDRVMLMDKIILRLAICEIIYFDSIPVKVSINEYLDLSRAYSTPRSSPFINGILDAVARTC